MAPTRRSLLRAGGAAAALGLAGCGSTSDGDEAPSTDSATETTTETAADATSTPELDRESLPAGALWLPPVRDPPGFAPGRFFRQVATAPVAATEGAMHPDVYDALSSELWDRPERLFGVSPDSIDAKYQVTGENLRVFEGSFDPGAVGEYLGRPFERVGERGDLQLFARQLRRGERLVAVSDRYLLAGGREDGTEAIDARFGVADPLATIDPHVWTAAVEIADADIVTVTDRYNKARRGLLAEVGARGIAWTFEGDRVRLTAPFVFFQPEVADRETIRTWADGFRGLETYEDRTITRDGRVVTVEATTPIELYDRGVSGRPGE